MVKQFRNKRPKYGSYSEDYLRSRAASPPTLSPIVSSSVSEHRRTSLSNDIRDGLYSDGGETRTPNNDETTYNSNVVSLSKTAQVVGGGGGEMHGGWLGSIGNTAMQMPEIYSPLWLTSNLNLPRDRATINAWCRAYYALNPIVHNAIQLHSTYPISKMNIKCSDPKAQNFFNDMSEELDLVNVCSQIAQEFYCLGEAYPYADFDPRRATWSRINIMNPDFIVVKRTAIAGDPIIMLRPDENLKNVVKGTRPSDIEQRKQLDPAIIDAVKRGQNIQLSNFNISQLARRISPYEIRGTGLPVACFRWLMLLDKLIENKFVQADNMINPLTLIKIGNDGMDGLHPTHADLEAWRAVFECHDEETEVMTDQGFKRFDEVMEWTESMTGTDNYPTISAVPKAGVKIACFNPDNEQIEYHEPINASLYDYSGDMYHFKNRKMDIKVTPNHKMWIATKEYEYIKDKPRKETWGEWRKVEAKNMNLSSYSRFRSQAEWIGQDNIKNVSVLGNNVPIELYLKFLGYVISEGYVSSDGKYKNIVSLSQTLKKHATKMKECMEKFGTYINKRCSSTISKISEKDSRRSDFWIGSFFGKDIFNHFKNEVGDEYGQTKSPFKKIPRWVLDLSPRLLSILIEALVDGDGTIKKWENTTSYEYFTTSKQLADDVFEAVYKCGMVPTCAIDTHHVDRLPVYVVYWAKNTERGNFPLVYRGKSKEERSINTRSSVFIEHYEGKVWCFEVPTGLFITRRNGKITIQGNSATANKDFKIFTHPGVNVERVGYNNALVDIANDLTLCIKMIYVGLQVPSVLMDGGQDTTYANGGVALDVLRQRYLQFREMMGIWLRRKIFAPIAELHGFYENKDGRKKLIVPEVEWNHMSLFDAGDYIQTLATLTTPAGEGQPPPRVSNHTLYRSLGLDFDDEQHKLKTEAIANAIFEKEGFSLKAMPLSELRALDTDEDIPEPTNPQQEAPLPGEDVGGGAPPGGLPGLPSPPSGGGSAPPPSTGGPPGGGAGSGLPGLGPEAASPPPAGSAAPPAAPPTT